MNGFFDWKQNFGDCRVRCFGRLLAGCVLAVLVAGSFPVAVQAAEAGLLLPAGEAGCGLADRAYSYDGGATWTDEPYVTVEQNGTTEVWVRDALGNVSKTSFTVDRLDREAPSLDCLAEPKGYVRDQITLFLTASDAASGLAQKPYSYDGGATWTEEPHCEITENGICRAAVRDAAGNVTMKEVEIWQIDQTGPALKLSLEPALWYEGEALLSVQAEDAGSGLAARPYSFDGGKTWQSSAAFPVSEPGEIHVLVRDVLGNCTERIYQAKRTGEAGSGAGNGGSGAGGNPGGGSGKEDGADGTADSGLGTDPGSRDGGTEEDAGTDPDAEGGETGPEAVNGEAENDAENMDGNGAAGTDGGGPRTDEGGRATAGGGLGGDSTGSGTPGTDELDEENGELEEPGTTAPDAAIETGHAGEAGTAAGSTSGTTLFWSLMRNGYARLLTLNKFFHTAAGRIILSVTAVALGLSLGGSILFFLYMGVRIYGYDGVEKYHYLGSVLLHSAGNRFTIRLTESMAEEALTDVYRIRPGWLLCRLHGGEGLLVEHPAQGQRCSLVISGQMECRLGE